MRSLPLFLAVLALSSLRTFAATPEQEKTFVEGYRKALEAGDAKGLAAFLHTKGAEADIVNLFQMMQSGHSGSKITSIELIAPTPEEAAKFNETKQLPNGKKYKMPVTPYKMLVIKTETERKTGAGSGSGSSRAPVAEIDGKLLIPVPIPAE